MPRSVTELVYGMTSGTNFSFAEAVRLLHEAHALDNRLNEPHPHFNIGTNREIYESYVAYYMKGN
jgi:hypothetical protein